MLFDVFIEEYFINGMKKYVLFLLLDSIDGGLEMLYWCFFLVMFCLNFVILLECYKNEMELSLNGVYLKSKYLSLGGKSFVLL